MAPAENLFEARTPGKICREEDVPICCRLHPPELPSAGRYGTECEQGQHPRLAILRTYGYAQSLPGRLPHWQRLLHDRLHYGNGGAVGGFVAKRLRYLTLHICPVEVVCLLNLPVLIEVRRADRPQKCYRAGCRAQPLAFFHCCQ